MPGQVFYDASRKLILKGVDGVVFVADSQIERMEANIESIENLRTNLAEQGYDLDKIPYVDPVQQARPAQRRRRSTSCSSCSTRRSVPDFEAVAPHRASASSTR